MEYEFGQMIIPNSDKKYLAIIFKEKKLEILSAFLFSEVRSHSGIDVLECIDKVLMGKLKSNEFHGNVYGIEISPDKTRVVDDLADDGEGNWCEIDTKELRNIVKIWYKKLLEFEKTQTL